MRLSQELIKNFVDATNDTNQPEKLTNVLGTVSRIQNGEVFVRVDGSNGETPVGTVSNVAVGDRVKVSISKHVATIDGNLTSPSARYADLLESEHKLQTNIEQTEERIKLYASETYQVIGDYATNTGLNNVKVTLESKIEQTSKNILLKVKEDYQPIGDYATNTGLNNVKVTLESSIEQTSKDILLEVKEDYQPIGDYATNDAVKLAKEAAIKVAADAIVSYVKANGGTTSYVQSPTGFTWTITKVENGVDATARADAIDGRKVATNYLAFGESKWGDGLVIGDLTKTTLGGNVQIVGGTDPAVNIRQGSTIYAKFRQTGLDVFGQTKWKGVLGLHKLVDISPEKTSFTFYNDNDATTEWCDIGDGHKQACFDCGEETYNASTKYQINRETSVEPGKIWMSHIGSTVGSSPDIYREFSYDVKNGSMLYTNKLDDSKLTMNLNGWSLTNGMYHSDDIGRIALYISGGNYYLRHNNPASTTATTPYYYLGGNSRRWKTLYIYNSAIETSDLKFKKDVKVLDDKYVYIFDNIEPVSYKLKNGDRTHAGFIAQDVEKAMLEAGLDILDLGLLCKDLQTDDDGNSILDENGNEQYDYGLRYSEFIAILSAKIKMLEKEILKLKGEE